MQITDPIADLLTRIRNASTAKHPSDVYKRQTNNLLGGKRNAKRYHRQEDRHDPDF